MTLTLSDGPLSGSPPDTNYSVEGPQHKLLFHEFPRRVRRRFEGATVVDTTRGRLLHETGILPVFYAPIEDLDRELLEESDHSTHCPFKGDASYWSVRVGERVGERIEDAAWSYPEPLDESLEARDHIAFSGEGIAVEVDGERVK